MTVSSILKIDKKVTLPTRHIRFAISKGRLFVVASRIMRFVDVLEIEGKNLTTDMETQTAIDLTNGKESGIHSLAVNPIAAGNSLLVAGDKITMKSLTLTL